MKKVAFILLIILAAGCQDVERPEPPEDLIALDKMADIMTEVYLGNAAKSVNNKIIRQSGIKLDSFVYGKYGIDSMQFVRSNAYYTSNLNAYNELFQEVEKKLIALKERNDSIKFGKPDSADTKKDTIQVGGELIDPIQPE